MKQTNRRTFFKSNVWHIATLALMLFSSFGIQQNIFASASPICVIDSCKTCTVTGTFGSATATLSYPSCVCVGDIFTIVGTLEVTSGYGGLGIALYDFAPNALVAGSTCPGLLTLAGQQTGPFPVIPGVDYIAADLTENCTFIPSSGQGHFKVPPGPNELIPNIVYTYSFNVLATISGVQFWTPRVNTPAGALGCDLLYEVTILVTPRAVLSNTAVATGCENNSGITGTLPPPVTGTVGPFFYDVGSPTGGTVTLTDSTSGDYVFVPSIGFTGTASFQYNVNPTGPGLPEFCVADPSGVVTIPIAPSPIVNNASINVCAGANVTGDLSPFVTGGSGSYTFSGPIGLQCTGASATVFPNGIYSFTAPTGAVTPCDFVYQVTDNTFPNCASTGLVTATINPPPIANNQTISTCVNQSVSGTLTATGGSGTFTIFTITSGPFNGVISPFNPATGDFTYTPNPLFVGSDFFTFTVTDSNGCTSITSGTVTIDVNPLPIAGSTAINGCENTSVTGSLVPLVTGGTGPFVFSQSGTPTCGGVFINSNGDFTFAPNFGFTGTCCFNYNVSQGGCAATAPGTVCVNVGPAPIITGATTGVCAGGTVTDNLNNYVISATGALTFTGGPGVNGILNLNPSGPFTFTPTIASGVASFMWDLISSAVPCPSAKATYTVNVFPHPTVNTGQISACSGVSKFGSLIGNVPGGCPPLIFTGPGVSLNGTTVINPNGTFTFTPNPGVTGGSFTFGVTDCHGCVATGTELVVVNPNPNASGATAGACAGSSSTGSLTGLVSGGTPGYIFGLGGPAVGGTVMISPNGIYIFTPSAGSTGGSFIYKVTDSNGCIALAPIDIIVNPGPSAHTGTFTGCEGTDVVGSLASLVTGPNPPFTFTGPFSQFNGITTINPNGDFTFVPTIITGIGGFTYEVTDSAVPPCTSKPTAVTIVVEQGPEALPSSFDTCENTPFMSGLAPYVSGGIPPFTFAEVPPFPTCGTVVINPANGNFTFTPNFGFTGPCNFIWQVTDSTPCASNTAVAQVTVHDNPVASDSGPFQACTLEPFTGNLNAFTTGGTPPYMFTGGNAVNGTLNLFPTGPFVFTPGIVVGPGSFQYSAKDIFGCMSNTGTISFNVNQSPILTGPSPLNTCQGVPVTSTVTATGGVPPYVSFSIVSTTNGTAVIDSTTATTATYTFTPTVTVFPTPTVVGSVTIAVTDSNPLTGGCTGQITILINIHQNPIASSTGINTCTGSLTGNLLPLVTGGIPPYIFAQTGTINPTGCGTVIISPLGDFIFTSPSGFSGPCTFDYQVTENSVSHCIATGAVTVNVSIPAVVSNLSICSCAGAPVTSSLAGLVSGGTPPFTFHIVGGICTNLGPQIVRCTVSGGTVILNTMTGQFTFTPNPGFLGTASFMFNVIDGKDCTSNTGTVIIQVPCCPFTGVTGVTLT